MNEKDVIKKLSPLKDVTPSPQRIKRMKNKIFMEIDGKNTQTKGIPHYDNYKNLQRWQYATFIVLILIIGIFSLPSVKKSIQPLVYSTRIALADNHYEKTKLVFEEAQMEFNSINDANITSYQEVMATTGTTNEYISRLHLQGEKGKYTSEQCKKLYQLYAFYLSTLNKHLRQVKQHKYEAEVLKYQQQAQARLAYYKS